MLSSRVGIADRSSRQRLSSGSESPLESQSLDLSTNSPVFRMIPPSEASKN
jgi:hypothetical protein